MALGWIRADDHDDVRLHDGLEFLRARRLADRVLQTEARGRMANARASVDVVIAERCANQLLHEERLFVRAAGGRDAAHRVLAVLRLNALELTGGVVDGLVPGRFLPGVRDLLANERRRDAIGVRRVAVREAA